MVLWENAARTSDKMKKKGVVVSKEAGSAVF